MKNHGNILTRGLLRMLALFRPRGWRAETAVEEPPLRSELLPIAARGTT